MSSSIQKFCLKWNDFQGLVTSAFEGLRREEELVDVTLCCEGRIIKAHKVMLSACSPYFKLVLKDNPCKHPVFFMKDVRYSDMAAILDFVYTGEVNVAQNNLSSFLKTAEALQVRGLTDGKQRSCSSESDSGGTKTAPCSAPAHPASVPLSATGGHKRSAQHASSERGATAVATSAKRVRRASRGNSPSVDRSDRADHITAEHVLTPTTESTWSDEQVKLEVHDDSLSGLEEAFEPDHLDDALSFETADASAHIEGAEVVPADAEDFLPDLSSAVAERLSRVLAGASVPPRHSSQTSSAGGFSCEFCGKVYRFRQSMYQHKMMHLGKTKCRVCGATLSSQQALKKHMRLMHPDSLSRMNTDDQAGNSAAGTSAASS